MDAYELPARRLELAHYGEIGAVFPAWGFSLRGEKMWTRDGFWVAPGEIAQFRTGASSSPRSSASCEPRSSGSCWGLDRR